MSRPLNEYPKEELIELMNAVFYFGVESSKAKFDILLKWSNEIRMAISDRTLADKELPFKTTEQK